MNKMAKGALATGVGVALLLGGGGTLATWNMSQNTSAGTVVSGNLALTPGAGKWQAGAAPAASAATLAPGFKPVPGDVFSYTQDLAVQLEGTNMVADLTTTNAVTKAFGDEATVAVTYSTDNGTTFKPAFDAPLTSSGTIKARITVNFADKGAGLNSVPASAGKTLDLTGVGFKLEQRAVPTPK